MTYWEQWLKAKMVKEGFGPDEDPVAGFKFNTGDADFADDHEHIQQELFKIILSKYPEESMEFFQGIAQRGDREVASLVRKLDKENSPMQMREPSHPSNDDEVVAPNADRGHNDDFSAD